VSTSLGSYQIPGTIPVGSNIRVRFQEANGGILAESQSFTVLSATGTLPATTASATATQSGNSNSASASSTGSAHSGAEGLARGSTVAFSLGALGALILSGFLA
jgi:hypothetical protein